MPQIQELRGLLVVVGVEHGTSDVEPRARSQKLPPVEDFAAVAQSRRQDPTFFDRFQEPLEIHHIYLTVVFRVDKRFSVAKRHTRRQARGMAGTSLIKKASAALRSENAKIAKRKVVEKIDTERTMTAGGVIAGAFGAALIDKKWGEDPEGDPVLVEPAAVKGIPVNLALGAAGTLGALFWKGMPMRSLVGGAFLGQGAAGVYRLAYDNIDFDK